ncbi:transcriptional repressor [Streptomyces californicus]
MSDLLERLRGRGWRLTSQRRVVAEVLNGDHVHLTADEVHVRAAALLPEISRATVYNTLGELVALGEVLEVSTVGRAKATTPTRAARTSIWCAPAAARRDVHPMGDALGDLPETERFGFTVGAVEITYRRPVPGLRLSGAGHPRRIGDQARASRMDVTS